MGYNLKDQKTGFDPLPADRYTLRIESTKVEPHTKDKVTGEKVEITYRVVGGNFDNRKVWENVYIPWALWKARGILEAGGSSAATSGDITAEGIAQAMVGLEMSAYIESSTTDTGATRTNVKEHKSLGDIDFLK